MAQIRCESVSEGLRTTEALAVFRDCRGRRHFLRVERDFLSSIGDHFYLPSELSVSIRAPVSS